MWSLLTKAESAPKLDPRSGELPASGQTVNVPWLNPDMKISSPRSY